MTKPASKKKTRNTQKELQVLIFGAGDGTRTRDRLITNQLLYQLSYTSKVRILYKKNNSLPAFFKNNVYRRTFWRCPLAFE